MPKTLTPKQVQEIYGFSEDTLATWRRREILDGKRRGPRWIPFGPHAIRYRVVDIEEWIAKQGPRLEQFRNLIDRARNEGAVSASMLAQIAAQARILLAR